MPKSHNRGSVTVSSWVSVAWSDTAAVLVARATVRPSGPVIRDSTWTSAPAPDSFTTVVATRTSARPAVTSGVVTYVPQRATCTGSVTTSRASR